MKILYISNSFIKGGAAKANSAFVNLLLKNGYHVDILSAKDIYISRKFSSIIKLIPYVLIRIYSKIFFIKSHYSFHFGGLIQPRDINNYDVLILGWLGNSTIDYRAIKNFNGKIFYRLSDEFAINLNGLHYEYNKNKHSMFEKFLCNVITLINLNSFNYFKNFCSNKITVICPSKWLLGKVENSDLNFKKTILVRNPKSEVMNAIEKIILKYPKKPKTSIFVCDNLDDPRKGAERVINLFKKFKEKKIIDKLIMVGFTSNPKKYSNEDIKVCGFLEKEKLIKLYCESNFYFHGAIVDNSPNSLIEAIIAKCIPIIFSDCEGAMEYARFAKINYIIDPQSFKIDKKINSNKNNSITFNGNFEFLNM